MSRGISLAGREYGLTTAKQQHINAMLQDYDRNLSLRRIQPGDAVLAFSLKQNPPHTYGVWEENVAPGQRNWVFTLAEMSIDERVLARVMENDMRRQGAPERIAKLQAFEAARQASQLKAELERREQRREEQLFIGRTAERKSEFRHRIDGKTVIIGSGLEERDPVTFVKPNRKIVTVRG